MGRESQIDFFDDSRYCKFTTNKVWNKPFWKNNSILCLLGGDGLKQIFTILLQIISMLKQQECTCDWTWTRIVMSLYCVNIWCSRESDEKRPISNFPKLSESKLFCLRARLSTNNQSPRLWFRVSTEDWRIILLNIRLPFETKITTSVLSRISFVHYWRAVNLVQLKTQTLLDKVMKRTMVSALHYSHSRTLLKV